MMRPGLRTLSQVLLLAVAPVVCEAADYPAPKEGDWLVRDFRFHTGQTLPELRLHYTTIGAPGGIPVLILHGTGQSAQNLLTDAFAGELFGPGQPLDATRYFIVLPDAIGHGQSSKPSDGLRARFPGYNYDDMVLAQYRLVTEHFGVRHLRAVLGTSMGGMHAWTWGERYPDFVDVVVPLASEPAAVGGRNWMLRRMVIDAIRHDPDWREGNYSQQPRGWRTAQVFFNQFEAARDYDPSPALERISARVLAINSADDERNPPELGAMEAAMKRLKNGRYVLLPVTDQSRGHGTTHNAALWKRYLDDLLTK